MKPGRAASIGIRLDLAGVEQTLRATGMVVRRLSDGEIFLELKTALHPLLRDPIPLLRPESSLRYRSAREQVVRRDPNGGVRIHVTAFVPLW